MTATSVMASESTIDRIFGTVVDPQTYRNMLYLALSFPLGIFYFVFLITGLSMGGGLLIVVIGAAILLLVFAAAEAFVRVERELLRVLLNTTVSTPAPRARTTGFWALLKAHFTRPSTWKGLVYLLLRFPMGIVSFVMLTVTLVTGGAMLTPPLTYTSIPIRIDTSQVLT